MRIDDPKSVRNASALKRKAASSGASSAEFQSLLETGGGQETTSAKPTVLPSISPMTGFIAGSWEMEEENKEKSKKYGEQMLKELEGLRHGLLSGEIGASTANRLLLSITRNRPAFIDPSLQEIIDDIELRAAVEAAKLEGRD